jgi:hypothetical protein
MQSSVSGHTTSSPRPFPSLVLTARQLKTVGCGNANMQGTERLCWTIASKVRDLRVLEPPPNVTANKRNTQDYPFCDRCQQISLSVVSLRCRPPLTPRMFPVVGRVDPRATVPMAEIGLLKIPVTLSGTEPATFRFCSILSQPIYIPTCPLGALR